MASSPTQRPSVHFQPSPQIPSKMSITQTFYLAHKARSKLSSEASRSDHNLRLLVGHANLLDSLMIRLSEAEQEQDIWYNNTVRGNEARDYPETIEEAEGEQYGSLATDYDSDSSEEGEGDEDKMDIDYFHPANKNTFMSRREAAIIDVSEVVEDYEDEEEEDVDEDGLFSLRRTTSHRPPSLCSDLSDDEDEESNPPSPPQPALHHPDYTTEEKMAVSTTSYYDSHHSPSSSISDEQLFFIPPSHPPTTLISTF